MNYNHNPTAVLGQPAIDSHQDLHQVLKTQLDRKISQQVQVTMLAAASKRACREDCWQSSLPGIHCWQLKMVEGHVCVCYPRPTSTGCVLPACMSKLEKVRYQGSGSALG